MAYVNEKADGREFEIPGFGKKTPRIWTRDEEKNAILFPYWVGREDSEKKYFFFQYKGYDVKIILDGNEFVDPNTKKWKLVSLDVPKGMSKHEVLVELRQAIEVYGCNGSCFSVMPSGKAVADF